MFNLNSVKTRILIFFSVAGPGIIAAIADNDAGGVATYSLLGSRFGYAMLFFLMLSGVLLAVTQEMGSRLAIVTGKGLGDLIREESGVRAALIVFFALFIASTGTSIANFAGLTAAAGLFGVPKVVALIIFFILISLIILRGSYQTNQTVFLSISLLYITYFFSAILAKPDWSLAFRSFVVPTNIPLTKEALFSTMAILGTTVTPWGQFFISSFVTDKRLTIDKLKYGRMEVIVGTMLCIFFAFFMMVATAATLNKYGIVIDTPQDAARAIIPFAGNFAGLFFGLGLLAASYMGAVIVPLTTAYAFSEFFGLEGSLDRKFHEGRVFYFLFVLQIFIASVLVSIPGVSLFRIVLYTQTLNAILLPFVLYYLVKFCNDRDLMKSHVNSRWMNFISGFSIVLILLATVVILLQSIFTILG